MVCRDERGRVLTTIAARIFAPNALVAEAMAMREALQLSRSFNLQNVVFESDNLALIEACRGRKEVREIQSILHDIRFIKASFNNCGFIVFANM